MEARVVGVAAPAARTIAGGHAAVARATDVCFAAVLVVAPLTKLQWDSAGGIVLADALTAAFLALLGWERLLHPKRRLPRATLHIVAFGVFLLAVYSFGFLPAAHIDHGANQVIKGLSRLALHFALLGAGVTYLAWRPGSYLWRAVGCLCAGITVCALYAGAQLVVHEAGGNLDAVVTSPLTGRPARTLVYGLNQSPDVPRVTGLTLDPDHLAVMLVLPILVLLALQPAAARGTSRRVALGSLIAYLLLVSAATFSRSGFLGLVAGATVIAISFRRRLWTREVLLPVGAVLAVLLVVAAVEPGRSDRILTSRLRADHTAMTHVHQYDFIPRALGTNAAFGVGLENFGRRYASITGKKDFGPHSFYVQSLAETGIVGSLAFLLFFAYIVARLRRAARAAADSREEALAVGLAAVLVGTMAANVFYLTMTFYYFYAFLIVVVAAGCVSTRPAAEPEATLVTTA
jgi:hypothetical protein